MVNIPERGSGVLPVDFGSAGGWLIMYKNRHDTSMRVTHRVKRFFGLKKAGHAGTLDPLATGILPIALGSGTPFIPFLMQYDKQYLFRVHWGESTSTDDVFGAVIASSSCKPSQADVHSILPYFVGEIFQKPPLYSAAKIKGRPSYALAREGIDVCLASKSIHIHNLDITGHGDHYTDFSVVCGSGTYVRGLARDMAHHLGTFGHVSILHRARVGPFSHGITLDELYKGNHGQLKPFFHQPQTVLMHYPSHILTNEECKLMWNGVDIPVTDKNLHQKCLHDDLVICYDHSSRLVALAKFFNERLAPSRCFIGKL